MWGIICLLIVAGFGGKHRLTSDPSYFSTVLHGGSLRIPLLLKGGGRSEGRPEIINYLFIISPGFIIVLGRLHCVLYTVYCILYTLYSVLYAMYCILYTV